MQQKTSFFSEYVGVPYIFNGLLIHKAVVPVGMSQDTNLPDTPHYTF